MRNRKTIACILLITGLFGQHVFASEDEHTTGALIGKTERGGNDVFYMVTNGRGWATLDKQAKITLLVGIDEGIALLVQKMVADRRSPKSIQDALDCMLYYEVGGFRFSDYVDQIDVFYSDTSNLRIPVIEAYSYTVV